MNLKHLFRAPRFYRFLRVKDRFNRRYLDPLLGYRLTRAQRLRRHEPAEPDPLEGYGRLHIRRPDGTTYCQWFKPEPPESESKNPD